MNFSVLMSIYAKESPKFLQQALESLKVQTLSAAEVVIVKDGIVGAELEAILAEYGAQLPIKVVGYEKNRGLGYALAFGLQQCRYDWIARMDADDVAVNDRFEKQFSFLEEHPEIGLLGSATTEFLQTIDEISEGRQRFLPLSHEDIVTFLKKRNAFNHMTVVFSKQAVLDAGNYMEAPGFEDYDLWVRMILNGVRTANLPESLVYVRVGNDMIGRRIGFRYACNEFRFYKKLRQRRFLSFTEFVKIIGMRIPLRLLPKPILAQIYKKLLRK